MYTNPSNIIKTVANLLEVNSLTINRAIAIYEPDKKLNVFEGMRKTIPAASMPSLEIEPQSTSNQWATTRSQRPKFTFNCSLTISNNQEELSVEYIGTVATAIIEVMTNPRNLNMRVLNETRWDTNGALVETFIIDSLVSDVTWSATKSGTIRVCDFSWFALIHEPFPESSWRAGSVGTPTIVRPTVLTNG